MYCYEDLNFNEEKKISVVNKKNPLIFYKNIKLENSYNYKKYFINKYNYKIKIKQLNENIKKQWICWFYMISLYDGRNHMVEWWIEWKNVKPEMSEKTRNELYNEMTGYGSRNLERRREKRNEYKYISQLVLFSL